MDSMPGSAHLATTMSAISLLGGFYGYAKTKSKRSLLAGIVFSGCYGMTSYWIKEAEYERAYKFGAYSGLSLAAVMGMRYYKSGFKRPMPAVPLILLGAATGAYYGKKYVEEMA